MTEPQMQPGEISRSLARIEASVESLRVEVRERDHATRDLVNAQLGPVSVHGEQIKTLREDVSELRDDVKDVIGRAHWIAGAWSAVTVSLGLGIAWLKGRG